MTNNNEELNKQDMEAELQRLREENETLKKIVPNGKEIALFNAAASRLRAEYNAVRALKAQYKAIVQEAAALKERYRTEMDELLTRLRSDVQAKEKV